MEPSDARRGDNLKVRCALSVEDLWDVETYFRKKKGGSEFVYDEGLDLFRFSEDGRFAFCREFADCGEAVVTSAAARCATYQRWTNKERLGDY